MSPTCAFRFATGQLLVAVALSLSTFLVEAHEYKAGALKIVHPFAAVSPPGATSEAAFIVRIENSLPQLLLHQHETTSTSVMRMREVAFISVEGGTSTDLGKESGYHLMRHELRTPLVAGDKIPATLYFAQAGPVDVVFVVAPAISGSADNPRHHKH